jgi:hypothetical protein
MERLLCSVIAGTDSLSTDIVDKSNQEASAMSAWTNRTLWARCGAGIIAGVLIRGLALILPNDALGRGLQVVAEVGFWFLMATAALLATQAIGFQGLHTSLAGLPQPRKVLLLVVGLSLALAFVIGAATREWLIFTSSSSSAVTGFGSLILDSLLGLIQVAAGSMIAFAALALLNHDRSSAEQAGPDRSRSPL